MRTTVLCKKEHETKIIYMLFSVTAYKKTSDHSKHKASLEEKWKLSMLKKKRKKKIIVTCFIATWILIKLLLLNLVLPL